MKKMELMRYAAKELLDFFSELYLENRYTNQTIRLQTQQGSFTLKDSGGYMSFYVYKTGTISCACKSFVGTKGDYHEYYVYGAEDDHEKVLAKFRSDLRKLRPYFYDFFMQASFEWDAWNSVIFNANEEFSTTLRPPCEDEDCEVDD